VCIGEGATRRCLHQQRYLLHGGHAQCRHILWIPDQAVLLLRVVALERLVALTDLPQLDRLVVGREQKVHGVLLLQPPNLIDLLLNLQRLEVVELGLVRLECRIDIVFAASRIGGF